LYAALSNNRDIVIMVNLYSF